jgi:hypothetical protein
MSVQFRFIAEATRNPQRELLDNLTELIKAIGLQSVGGSGDPYRGDRFRFMIKNRASKAV